MKLDNIFELSYCINLKSRPDRWELCQDEFYKLNWYPERFEAIEDLIPARGCLLSHIAILKDAFEKKKNVLIFEDDMEVINFEEKLIEKALDELYDKKWDMLYLGGNILRPFYQETQHLAKLNHCQSTHAYGVNKDFLGKLIPFLENTSTFIDVTYAEGVIPHANCYITIPMMVIQRESYSDIEKRIMDYSIPMERYNHFLVRKQTKKEG